MTTTEDEPRVTLLAPAERDGAGAARAFANDVRRGLGTAPKTLPCRYLYDDRGSRLFREIMDLPAYYPTRCEAEILETHGASLAKRIGKTPFRLVELGAGDGAKTRILIERMLDRGAELRYVPLDCSGSALRGLLEACAVAFPDLEVEGLQADYGRGLAWLAGRDDRRNVVLFLGSSLGNFPPEEARRLLSDLRRTLNAGDLFLAGFDLRKDVDVMVAAYDDPEGVTAEFNLNLLRRMNRELGAHFDRELFRFYATWNPLAGAVQSFLVSLAEQTVRVDALDGDVVFEPWEAVHTESSFKFTEKGIGALAREAGFEPVASFTDGRGWFLDALWRVPEGGCAGMPDSRRPHAEERKTS